MFIRYTLIGIAVFRMSAVGAEPTARDRASAESVVISQMLREWSNPLEAMIVDLPTEDVDLIRRAAPGLSKFLLATGEANQQRLMRPPSPAPSATPTNRIYFSLRVVRIDSSEAIISVGSLSDPLAPRDRFELHKKRGEWQITHRDFHTKDI